MNEPADSERRRELAANLDALTDRIARACARADRPVDAVRLIAVTKTFPATDVALLAELGITDVGENRDQEAAAKVAAVRSLEEAAGGPPLRWHFIGALQTNKCASVVTYASLVHSVDRLRLVDALGRAARDAAAASDRDTRVGCLVQVDLDDVSHPERGGARPQDVETVAAAIAQHPHLRLVGVMAVAPLGADPAVAFRLLATVADQVRQRHPDATIISAGMSGDLEAAIAYGATHLRVGAALLGDRRHPVG